MAQPEIIQNPAHAVEGMGKADAGAMADIVVQQQKEREKMPVCTPEDPDGDGNESTDLDFPAIPGFDAPVGQDNGNPKKEGTKDGGPKNPQPTGDTGNQQANQDKVGEPAGNEANSDDCPEEDGTGEGSGQKAPQVPPPKGQEHTGGKGGGSKAQ